MSKRSKLSNGFHPLQECCEDRISELRDELLVNILSRSTLKEAGQSSIMSSRWKTLWTFKTGLDFADLVALSQARRCYQLLPVVYRMIDKYTKMANQLQNIRNKYAKMVNQVVKSYQGENIDGFKVCFELDNTYKSDLDSWIEFAIPKKSQMLKVDLKQEYKRDQNPYYFPKVIFLSLKSNLKILRSIRLCWVEVRGPADLQDILTNCTSLEALSIQVQHNKSLANP